MSRVLTVEEIYRYAVMAGFTPDEAVTMTAIALAESGGRTGAHNQSGEDSVGLWQINRDAWPQFTTEQLREGRYNAYAAKQVYDQQGIAAWTVTHQDKGARYLQYINQVRNVAAGLGYENAWGYDGGAAEGYQSGWVGAGYDGRGGSGEGHTGHGAGTTGMPPSQYAVPTYQAPDTSAPGPLSGNPLPFPTSPNGGYPGPMSPEDMKTANRDSVQALLAQQFGGFSFFFDPANTDMQVGVTAWAAIVPVGDPQAVKTMNALEAIVELGITAPTRVLGIIQKTKWYQNTDTAMREFDAMWGEMSPVQQQEYLEPILDLLNDEAQYLGFQLDPNRAFELAKLIQRMGNAEDQEYVRGLLVNEAEFDAFRTDASGFAFSRDTVKGKGRQYFVPIDDKLAAEWAEQLYTGERTEAELEQYFRNQAKARFPYLAEYLDTGMTSEEYFSPYKYEIEKMLGRPNVDLLEEFADVIEFRGPEGVRPMTIDETRQYVRGLPEWQASTNGKSEALSMVDALARSFGAVR